MLESPSADAECLLGGRGGRVGGLEGGGRVGGVRSGGEGVLCGPRRGFLASSASSTEVWLFPSPAIIVGVGSLLKAWS